MMRAGSAFKGRELDELKSFLKEMDLSYDDGIDYTVCLLDEDGKIIGTGSAEQNVLKCIAIHPDCRGQGLAATLVSQLTQHEFEQGTTHIFMFTKSTNQSLFEDLGFYTIYNTGRVLFMENRKKGFSDFIEKIKKETPEDALKPEKKIGAIVANCNPFTKGHRYLMEQAAKECDYVHVFVLSDKRSEIPAEDRFRLVKEGAGDIEGLIFHRASDYIISAATFPTYFIKDKKQAEEANCRLDVELFGKRIAPEFNIQCRYVGTEPACRVTGAYNQVMQEVLPECGVEVKEITRLDCDGSFISASKVRTAAKDGRLDEIRKMIPETTYEYMKQRYSK